MKKLNYLLKTLPLLLSSIILQAQTWDPIGNGIGQDVSYRNDVEVYNNELYVSEIIWNGTTPGTEVKLRKWDGQLWVNIPSYTSSVFTEFGDMAIYQGEIYLGLVAASGTTQWLVKFDGTQWSPVSVLNGVNWGAVRALKVHNGELYIGGLFNVSIGGSSYENIIKYDGTNYSGLPGLTGNQRVVTDIHFHNNDLYCKSGTSVYKWNGSSFGLNAQMSVFDMRSSFISYNNELYCASGESLYKVVGGNANFITSLPYKIQDMDVLNGELYLVGDSVNWVLGGGLTRYDGQTFTTLTAPDGLHAGEVYNGELHYFSCSVTFYNATQYDRAFKMGARVGLSENSLEEAEIRIYPNPASEMFYVENSLKVEQEVKLIDATGKVLRNISLEPSSKAEVETGSLAPGMYFINNGSSTHQVIITP